ncbi:unnamed protein product [Gordionus sp. m RMFG-2023]|uniref:vacuolar protein sorting-associated protein 35-like isoform X2 n=1 Tax=Gordionus sp. m RMFG-2023 TaxID=3053472 RepID=UPI0030E0ADD3
MVHSQINEEQERFLNEALTNVKSQASQMKNCFDKSKLMDGLKFCSTMLNELRTSDLSPKSYYALYMSVVDELRYLEGFLIEEVKKNIKITDIYELVQYAGNIVPRLYLLITVGVVYIKTLPINTLDNKQTNNVVNKKAEIIRDLVEMCRGVQHPLRGLFLRYYLLQSLRNSLPDNKPIENSYKTQTQKDSTHFVENDLKKDADNIIDNGINIEYNIVNNTNGINGSGDREMITKSNPNNIIDGGLDDNTNISVIDIEDEENHLKSFQNSNNLNRLSHHLSASSSSSVLDSVEFLLLNFGEMNKLWVRMQHLGHSKDKDKREMERRDLRLLVGTNLVRLSELDNVQIDEYKKIILPGILEQIVSCRDVIAQEYIMECIIQVFPDEFHLATLNSFLKACSQLHPDVKVKNIMICLINRLARYAQKEGPSSLVIDEDIKLFDVFSEQISQIIQARSNVISSEDIVCLQSCLINLALTCYPQNMEYVDRCLDTMTKIFKKMNILKIHHASIICKELSKMVKSIVDGYMHDGDLLKIARLNHLAPLFWFFDRASTLDVCGYLVGKLLEKGSLITDAKMVNDVMNLLKPILSNEISGKEQHREESQISRADVDESDEVDAQIELAKLINLVKSPGNLDMHFLLLKTVYSYFEHLPASKIKYSIPTIVFGCLSICENLLGSYDEGGSISNEESHLSAKLLTITKFVHSSIFVMSERELYEQALKLYLQASLAVNSLVANIKAKPDLAKSFRMEEFESVAYEFMSQSFSIYEDDIADSKTLFTCLNIITSTFSSISCFGAENHESLRRQCFSSASKLLKKPDQARALCLISHVFWSSLISNESDLVPKRVQDGEKVMTCLNKTIKITNQCLNNEVKLQLYTEILNNAYILHNEGCTELQTQGFMTDLIDKINSELIPSITNTISEDKGKINPLMIKQYKSIEELIVNGKTELLAEKIKLVKI